MSANLCRLLDTPPDKAQLNEALSGFLSAEWTKSVKHRDEVLDTFGWTIWRSGRLLFRRSVNHLLLLEDDGTICATEKTRTKVRFWWELPDGKLRETLAPLTEFWSFNPEFTLRAGHQLVNLRNKDNKIVARLRLVVDADSGSTHLSLEGLQGYENSSGQAWKLIRHLGGRNTCACAHQSLLQARGIEPRTVNTKPHFGIEPTQSTGSTIRLIIHRILREARQFETGVLEDRDTEFAHQYRVCIRKSRSIVNLMKGALPKATQNVLDQCLKRLVGPFGRLRDLDVFLLAKTDYASLLPSGFEDSIEALFASVAKDRRRALARVRRWLRSPDYEQVLTSVFAILDEPDRNKGKHAKKPIKDELRKCARKNYRTIRKISVSIGNDTPDAKVHELRIECKKLRYLLEFFSEILPASETRSLLKALEKLQDVLGSFNDCVVQQVFLQNYANSHQSSAPLNAASTALIAVLHNRQLVARQQVLSALAEFGAPNVEASFRKVFGKFER